MGIGSLFKKGIEMDSNIVQTLITAVSLIVVQIIISIKQHKISDIKHEYNLKIVEDSIKRLEEKQNKHNNLIERMTIVERDMKTAYNKLNELRTDIHELSQRK